MFVSFFVDDIKRVINDCNTRYILTVPAFVSKVKETVADTGVKVGKDYIIHM